MQMVIFMKDNGKMIKRMEKEHFYMLMELITMVIGLMINKMESVWNVGKMEQNSKVIMLMEKKKGKEN
jgi:hypothetical protein